MIYDGPNSVKRFLGRYCNIFVLHGDNRLLGIGTPENEFLAPAPCLVGSLLTHLHQIALLESVLNTHIQRDILHLVRLLLAQIAQREIVLREVQLETIRYTLVRLGRGICVIHFVCVFFWFI